MFTKLDYVMVIVSDMNRSVEFYRDKLGIPLKFQTDGTTLALHGGGTGEPTTRAAGCSFGFNVANLDQIFADLTSKGVQFAVPPKVRDGEGINLAVCMDPDGLPISFAESLRK